MCFEQPISEYPCGCECHVSDGVSHIAPCCYPPNDEEPATGDELNDFLNRFLGKSRH